MPLPSIALIPIDRACAALLARHPAALDEQRSVDSSDVREHMASVLKLTPAAMLDAGAWGTFFAYEKDTRRVVGACGFKAPPSPGEAVEIAYFTFPPCEGHGFATAMVDTLVTHALSSIDVGEVIAHTLPQYNASTRILEKCAFVRAGEHTDPDVGLVWRWRYGP
jgi:ribosomal-protein-alanine N-acetyltransferase